MRPGRPRRFDPSVPKHIDQTKLPNGAYWKGRDQVWYTLLKEGEKSVWKRLAGPTATLADLHRLLQELNTPNSTGTIKWVHEEFMASEQWKELSPSTQTGYEKSMVRLGKLKTKVGVTADLLVANKISRVNVQLIVDEIAKKTPSMANAVQRYLGRLFAWAMRHGRMRVRENPAHDIEAATERGDHKMPSPAAMEAVMAFARERGARKAHTMGSCSPFIWPAMVLAYRCRQRGIEALLLTDADKHEEGLYITRRKGSKDNLTRWSPEIRAACAFAAEYRREVWNRLKKEHPLRPEDRPLLINQKGETLAKLNSDGEVVTRSGFDSAWQRFIHMAMREGVITPEQRFSLHGLKHRGITDTEGGREAKKAGGGHKTEQMMEHYDHEVVVVDQAGRSKK